MINNSALQHQDERITALEEGQKDMKEWQNRVIEMLEPISDTYKSARTIGKWGMSLLILMSIIVGILLGIKQLK